MSETAVATVDPLIPGPLSQQGIAIAARLQLVFSPLRYQFKFLPEKIDRKAWSDVANGSQPFLGLGFAGMMNSKIDGRTVKGNAMWSLLCAVRKSNSTPKAKFYGDASPSGLGVFDIATTAAAVLNGFDCVTGTITVNALKNIAAEWTDDTAMIEIVMEIPTNLPLYDAITKPSMGLFGELNTTWNEPVPEGSVDIYDSDWINPNVPA